MEPLKNGRKVDPRGTKNLKRVRVTWRGDEEQCSLVPPILELVDASTQSLVADFHEQLQCLWS